MTTAITLDSTTTRSSNALHVGLWITQGLLAFAFFGAGLMKLTTPIDALAVQMGWVESVPAGLVRFIGAAEVAGALGLILPAATRIQPRLTVWAAVGLVTVMALAFLTHATRGEWPMIAPNVVLGGLAAFVAWGRATKSPIASR